MVVLVCATTGVAATNYLGGSTVHSAFGLPLYSPTDTDLIVNQYQTQIHPGTSKGCLLSVDLVSLT